MEINEGHFGGARLIEGILDQGWRFFSFVGGTRALEHHGFAKRASAPGTIHGLGLSRALRRERRKIQIDPAFP